MVIGLPLLIVRRSSDDKDNWILNDGVGEIVTSRSIAQCLSDLDFILSIISLDDSDRNRSELMSSSLMRIYVSRPIILSTAVPYVALLR